jgi:hypothetical protein
MPSHFFTIACPYCRKPEGELTLEVTYPERPDATDCSGTVTLAAGTDQAVCGHTVWIGGTCRAPGIEPRWGWLNPRMPIEENPRLADFFPRLAETVKMFANLPYDPTGTWGPMHVDTTEGMSVAPLIARDEDPDDTPVIAGDVISFREARKVVDGLVNMLRLMPHHPRG